MKRLALVALVACKGSTGKPATPEEARAVAGQLLAAIEKCDHAAIDKLVDPVALGKRAGGDESFGAIALDAFHENGPCPTKSDYQRMKWSLVADTTKPALRYEIMRTHGDLVETVGYLVLVVEQPPHIVDLRPALVPESIVERLKWNWDEPVNDHRGRLGDTFYVAFEGAETSGFTLVDHFEADVEAKAPKEELLGRRIDYGSRSWNSLAVEHAVAKVEALVGQDPYLTDLVAAVHRPEPAQMLARARTVTAAHPTLADGWITQFYAEALTGDFDAAMTSLDVLVTKFSFDWRPLGKQLPLARFTASPAFTQKYPL